MPKTIEKKAIWVGIGGGFNNIQSTVFIQYSICDETEKAFQTLKAELSSRSQNRCRIDSSIKSGGDKIISHIVKADLKANIVSDIINVIFAQHQIVRAVVPL